MNSRIRLLIVLLLITGIVRAQGARYAVQLEAAPTRGEAEARVNQLKASEVQAYIVRSNVPGKGTFYRVRVGNFANMNEARKFGDGLVRKGVIPEFFVAPYEAPRDETAAAKPAVKPNPAPPTPAAATKEPPKTVAKEPAPQGPQTTQAAINNSPPKNTPAPKNTTEPVAAAPNPPAASAPAASTAAFTRFQDPAGYSFEYPSYWTGQQLNSKEASEQRVNAGALFKSAEDSAFLNAIWNKLDKANSPENDNDLIVEIILKSMASGDGTQLKETSRKVVNENGLVKTYLDLRAAFQSTGQAAPLDFLGKAVIVRANKGILLVVAFYSKDAPATSATIADRIIASVRPPE